MSRAVARGTSEPDILSRLEHVRQNGNGWTARCPAHEDRRSSLSIRRGDKQALVLKCHAGCSYDAIVAAAGLTKADLRDRGNGSSPEIVATYPYHDEHGKHLYDVVRFSPKDFRQRRADGRWNMRGVRRVVYWLPELQHQKVVFVTEGEKDADRLRGLQLAATTNAAGAGRWRGEHTEQIRAAGVESVVIVPDNDEPGRLHAETIARSCHAAGLHVKVLALPGLAAKGDVSDWLGAGHTREELLALIDATPAYTPGGSTTTTTTPSAPRPPRPGSVSPATRLIDLALADGAELWHTPPGDPYITIPFAGYCEHHLMPARGTVAVRQWLARLHQVATGSAPGTSAVLDAIGTLAGIARYDGAEHPVWVRVAEHVGAIYLDLGAPRGAVAITRDGWSVVSDPPVRFRRARGLLPLPAPESGGAIADMSAILGLDGDDATLTAAWLIGALRPTGPYPILSLSGEQGSGKSTRARMIRALIDPHEAGLRAEPREVRDLMIAASSGWIIALDNVSRVQDWLSDALCRLSTGGALGARTLYSDSDETILSAVRPVILTGVAEVATRGDLVDRCVSLTLPPLDDRHRRTEAGLWADYKQQHPRLLGALLDAVSGALRAHHQIVLPILPRMADWCTWVSAAESACGWPERTLLRAYVGSRQSAIEVMLDGDILAAAIRRLILPWTGTAAELLERLTPATRPPQGWPSSPRGLSAALRRLAPALRRIGIQITTAREAGTGSRRLISVMDSEGVQPSRPAQRSQPADLRADSCDGRGDGASQPASHETGRLAWGGDRCDGRDGPAPTLYGGRDDGRF